MGDSSERAFCSPACRDAWKPETKRACEPWCGLPFVDDRVPTTAERASKYRRGPYEVREPGFCSKACLDVWLTGPAVVAKADTVAIAGPPVPGAAAVVTRPCTPWCGELQATMEVSHPAVDAIDAFWDPRDTRGYCRRGCLETAVVRFFASWSDQDASRPPAPPPV